MLLSYVKQAILFPRLILILSLFLLFSSPTYALETVFITGFSPPTSGADTDSVVLMSIDNGASWALQDSVFNLRETRSIIALNSSNYFAAGGSSGADPTGYTFQTGGDSLGQSVSSGLLQSVDAASGAYYTAGATTNQGTVANPLYYGTILKSTDGTNWTTQVSSGSKLNAISAVTDTVAYAVGASGTVQKTTNGTNWSSQTTNSNYVLYGVDAVNSTTAYAVGKSGSDGVILKTTNGTSWSTSQTISGIPLNAISVTPDNPNVAFAVGDGSAILQTTDGSTWSDSGFSTFGGGALSSIYAVSSTKAYAVGVIGSVAILDGGFWVDISASIPTAYQNYNFTGVSVFTATPIPEPSTIILSVVAVSVLAIIQRTRRSAPKPV